MFITVTVLFVLPILAFCTSDGNINLLKEDIAVALQSCSNVNDKAHSKGPNEKRPRRSSDNMYDDPSPRIDDNRKQEMNQYNHERRNTTMNKMLILNGSNSDANYAGGYGGKKFVKAISHSILNNKINNKHQKYTRTKRNGPLISKDDNDQCLSQCVFANLHVVNSKGIPREAELWNKVQTSVTSQQSRILVKDQIRACFQELKNESEDNGCSYSNKLERCLMLRLSDRKTNGTQGN